MERNEYDPLPTIAAPVEMWTVASGLLGCGALSLALSYWVLLPWRGIEIGRVMDGGCSITWMKLLLIVLNSVVWDPVLRRWLIVGSL